MKRKRVWITLSLIIVMVSGAFIYLQSRSSSDQEKTDPFVVAEIGTVVEKALAVGNIEPENEIEIKSKISGVVSKIFAQPGDYVRAGEPLIEVRPDPTPLELAEAKRNLQRTQIEKNSIEIDLERMRVLRERNLVSQQEYDQLYQRYQDVDVRLQINRERLGLLESGRVSIGDTVIESIIRSPIDGYILEKMVDVGEPVVPLTSYQAGTALMSIAGMDRLLLKARLMK